MALEKEAREGAWMVLELCLFDGLLLLVEDRTRVQDQNKVAVRIYSLLLVAG
jgi:hypothetical protein